MSESVQIALIVAAFPTVSVIISSFFAYLNNKKADGKLNQIHELTNSSATKANAKIASLEKLLRASIKKEK